MTSSGSTGAAAAAPSMEHHAARAMWDGYLLFRLSLVANAAVVTMDPKRGPRSRPLAWLATGIAGATTLWEWRRRQGRDPSENDPVMAAEVIVTSLALTALSPAIVHDADRGRGDDWFGLWGWWGNAAIALAMPNRPEPAMLVHLIPQADAWRHRRPWLPTDTASRNMLNSIGVAIGSGWAVSKVAAVGAEADRASSRLVTEQARLLANQARREVRERHLHRTVESLDEIRRLLSDGRIDEARTLSASVYEPLRAWLAGAEDDEMASPTQAAAGYAAEVTRLVSRTERGMSAGDIAVVAAAALNTLSVTGSRFNRQHRRGWVVAGFTSSLIYAGAVALGRFGVRERPGATSPPPPFLDRTSNPHADTLFAVLLMAFECASSDRNVASTWSAGQTQVHIAVAATRITEFPKLLRAWAVMGMAMFAADRYYTPQARAHRFRWQADWVVGMAAGLALRRSHSAIMNALDELERSAIDTIAAVAEQVAEAEMLAAQDAVHDTACQSLRYLLTHPDVDPGHLAEIIGSTIEALETELSGGEHDESEALADALVACAAGYELLGLSPTIESTGDRPVGGAVMEVLVQVANQGLANALAHSDDAAPHISLQLGRSSVRLTVSNDAEVPHRGDGEAPGELPGPADSPPDGGDEPELPAGGFGLPSARRATEALGGTLRWGMHPNSTQLIVDLPLPSPDNLG